MIPLRDELPTLRKPFVTVGLIILNCAVFLWQILQPEDVQQKIVFAFGAIPLYLTRDFHLLPQFPDYWPTVLSSMFLHGGILHLGGNMLYLWIFGNNVEDALGHVKFILFYLLSGFVAAAAHVMAQVNSPIPMIGASGAISGVLGAYLLLYPRARVVVMFWFFFFIRLVRVPAFIVLGLWFVMQLTGILGNPGGTGGGVALFAHVGGFVFGLLTIYLFRPRPPYRPYFG
jgi:membrane associated rhomboid family serine protease